MITWLRWKRKGFIKKNEVPKYLIYGLGEILLVVIGILIALQIDNIKEEGKKTELEIRTYHELKADLEETLNEVKSDLRGHLRDLESAKTLQSYLFKKAGNRDSVAYHFRNMINDRQFDPSTSAYQSLLSRGIGLLRNDSIRQYISEKYLSIDRLKAQGPNNNSNSSFELLMDPFVSKYLAITVDILEKRDYMDSRVRFNIHQYRFVNHDEMLNDRNLKVKLQELIIKRGNLCGRHYEIIFEIEHLLNLIDIELRRLQ